LLGSNWLSSSNWAGVSDNVSGGHWLISNSGSSQWGLSDDRGLDWGLLDDLDWGLLDDWLLDNLGLVDWGLLDNLLDWLLNNLLDWLLDNLLLNDWLLDNLLDLLDLLDLWLLVNNLSADLLVLNSLLDSFVGDVHVVDSLLWDVVNVLVNVGVWDVISLVLNGIVVSDSSLVWDDLNSLDLLVFDVGLFVWDVLDSGLSSDWGLLLDGGVDLSLWLWLNNLLLDNLLDNWLLNNLLDNWLLNNLLNWLLDDWGNRLSNSLWDNLRDSGNWEGSWRLVDWDSVSGWNGITDDWNITHYY